MAKEKKYVIKKLPSKEESMKQNGIKLNDRTFTMEPNGSITITTLKDTLKRLKNGK